MQLGADDDVSAEQENSPDVDELEPEADETKNSGARKKKRNRTKNKKKKSGSNAKVDEDIERELQFIEDENQAPKQVVEQSSSTEATIDSLLTIHLRNLKYENEVYKKFGSEAVKAEGGLGGAKGGPRIANRSILVRDAGKFPRIPVTIFTLGEEFAKEIFGCPIWTGLSSAYISVPSPRFTLRRDERSQSWGCHHETHRYCESVRVLLFVGLLASTGRIRVHSGLR